MAESRASPIFSNDSLILSASDGGRFVKVLATTAPGTLIHQASSAGPTFEDVTLYATNGDPAADFILTVVVGNSTDIWDAIPLTIVKKTGLIALGTIRLARGYPIYAFADTASKIGISGFVSPVR